MKLHKIVEDILNGFICLLRVSKREASPGHLQGRLHTRYRWATYLTVARLFDNRYISRLYPRVLQVGKPHVSPYLSACSKLAELGEKRLEIDVFSFIAMTEGVFQTALRGLYP